MTKISAIVLALLSLGACYGPDPNLTSSGTGRPEVELEAPEAATAGTIQTVTLTVTNPGPAKMDSVVVAFSRLGDPALPPPLVDVGPRKQRAVVTVEPKPNAVSPDGVIYTFDGLGEGDAAEFSFELRIPQAQDTTGNAILVYDGADPERARGVRLEVRVER